MKINSFEVLRLIQKMSPAEREDLEERAGILEFCHGLSRDEAEKTALEMVINNRETSGKQAHTDPSSSAGKFDTPRG